MLFVFGHSKEAGDIMKNSQKRLLVIGTSILLIGIVTSIGVIIAFKSYFGSSDEDIVRYVQKKHNVNSEVLISPEQYDAGSLNLSDAEVVTLDEDRIEFSVQVNNLHHIESDNYDKKKKSHDANKKLLTSKPIQRLKNNGFRDFTFDPNQKSVDFFMNLPENMNFTDEEAFKLVYEAFPDMKSLQETARKSGNKVKVVSISGILVDITDTYDSIDDMKTHIKDKNPESFETYLSQDEIGAVDSIKSDLQAVGFDTERPTEEVLKCGDYSDDGKCVGIVYHLYTFGVEGAPKDSPIQYDNVKELERLQKALLSLQSSDVPIRRVILHSLYAPKTAFYQNLPAAEVKEIEGTEDDAFETVTAEISIMHQQFDDLSTIQFDYNEPKD